MQRSRARRNTRSLVLVSITCRVVGFAAAISSSAAAEPATGYFDETRAVTLFAFDDQSIASSQNLKLVMRSPEKHPANPVVARGGPGSVDAMGVQFYGSVIREGDKYRLWYVAYDDDTQNTVPYSRWRAGYAESRDGVTWVKPELGLVEYHGNKRNNLIDIGTDPLGFINLKVLADSDDADPSRRYKISTHVYFRHNTRLGTLAPFISGDGLRWKPVAEIEPKNAELTKKDLVLPAVHFEPCGGLYKWDGLYYVCGQNALWAPRPYQGRVTRMYHSADFKTWSHANTVGFVRDPQHFPLGPGRSLEGEQCHEGISVWNRRNVLLGVYGMWHGAKDWKDITIDLGFVVSNDGVRFREPAREWTFLKRGEDDAWDQGGLLQGQGFENIGDETFVYYGAWDPRRWKEAAPRGGVGIARLPRDRFGELVVDTSGTGPGDYQLPITTSEFITTVVPLPAGDAPRLYVNAEGLGPEATLRIELLDELEKPLPGYSGKAAAIVDQNGFQVPVVWDEKENLTGLPKKIRARVAFEGKKKTDIRFSALYLHNP
jgi:hypothetical protein